MNNLLIDTNVFIYDLDRSSQHHDDAHKVLNSDNLLFTSNKNISEFFAVLTKLEVDNSLIWEYYKDIKKNIDILYSAPGSLQIFENLYNKYLPRGNRIYDLEMQPKVMHGASEILIQIFEEKGRHARTAIGVSVLPRNLAVVVDIQAMSNPELSEE
ncbi:MAG: Atu1372/SO_1960 family protein [Halomonas sp.]